MTGLAQPHPEEPRIEEPTRAETDMMWAEEKKYFGFNPHTAGLNRAAIARIPHLPIETVHIATEDERAERIKNWVTVSNSNADPNDQLPGHVVPEDPVADEETEDQQPKRIPIQPFELSAAFVQSHDKKPIILAAATEVGSCEPSIHSQWSTMANTVPQPFGELLGHVDNGADSVRDMFVDP